VVDAATALVLTVKVAGGGSGGNCPRSKVRWPPVITSKRNLRTACGSRPAQRYCPRGGIPARNTGRVSESEERETDAAAEEDSSSPGPRGLGSFGERATNFEGEII